MDSQVAFTGLLISFLLNFNIASCQESTKIEPKVDKSELFISNQTLPITIRYSNRDIKKETNDSTFITTQLHFKKANSEWDSLEVNMRRSGNFRLKNCYFAPIKLKIKKKESEETPFEGHKTLKLVMPCLLQKDANDNVIKEYLIYKFYEIVSPYYFKSRLVDLKFEEIKGNKIKDHEIKGILIEDDKHVAKRIGGKVWERTVHPLNQMPIETVRNAMFQFMIGNTDFSQAYRHNTKLIIVGGQIIPVPYDFDMSGFVNTSYSTVSQIGDQVLQIEKVTDRMYRGFKRDEVLLKEVRQEFLENRIAIFNALQSCEALFENEREYIIAKEYLDSFYNIISDDNKFKSQILDMARDK